jgi:uncharacterized membrane protein
MLLQVPTCLLVLATSAMLGVCRLGKFSYIDYSTELLAAHSAGRVRRLLSKRSTIYLFIFIFIGEAHTINSPSAYHIYIVLEEKNKLAL